LDRAHIGDIEGALGTVHAFDTGPRLSARRKLGTLAIIALAAGIVLLPALPLGTVTTLVQAFAGILLPSTLVLLLILCNDKQLLGPLTNGRWLNASAITAVTVILALSTMLTLTAVVPHLRLVIALAVTVGMLGTAGSLLALSYVRGRRPRTRAAPLTPWQHRTWSAPPLELVTAPTPTRPRLLALAMLRGYIILIAALLLLKLAGVFPG
jgi:hypothetical protein